MQGIIILVFYTLLYLLVVPASLMAGEGHAEAVEIAPGQTPVVAITARAPRVGEWMEYRIAFPVDPLENSLRADPAPQPQVGDGRLTGEDVVEVDGEYYIRPTFEPGTAWRTLPLRLEIESVDALGFEAFLTFESKRGKYHFPIEGGLPGGEFVYDPQKDMERHVAVSLNGTEYEATATIRHGENFGFARMAGEDAPFGLFRFATAHVDLVLVGMGADEPPPFPLNLEEAITPPIGLFYLPVRQGRESYGVLDEDR